MSRYIEREAVMKTARDGYHSDFGKSMADLTSLREVLEDTPTADVAEVRHGKWQPCYEDWRKQIEGDECSACGFQHYGTNIRDYPYCPNCGARMDGGVKE